MVDAQIMDVQIVLGEALNNIVEHGYNPGELGTIDTEVEVFNDAIIVRITDDGKEYFPPDNTRTPLSENSEFDTLPEGGFGWFLIKEITASIEFQRQSEKNTLVLHFQ